MRYSFPQLWFGMGKDEVWDGLGDLLASVLFHGENGGDLAAPDHQ